MRDDFAIFILSHGRADNVRTAKTICNCGYTSNWYILIDDEDKQLLRYKELYGDRVLVFSKKDVKCDPMDNFGNMGVVMYSRNMAQVIARNMGYRYILELDDDYRAIYCRYEDGDYLRCLRVFGGFDKVVDAVISYMKESNAKSICFSQTGDFIGGKDSSMWASKVKRKAMNSFFIDVENPVDFIGTLNEDVNTYLEDGKRGGLYLTIRDMSIKQMDTQTIAGGMTSTYGELGTYVKSFYSVMSSPACVKIGSMITDYQRIHHIIDWNSAVPKIISSVYKDSVGDSE